LTPLEIQAVCVAFSGKYAIRNRTLFLLCANIGTRITEALNLNVGDVLQNGEVVEVLYLRRQTVKGKQSGVSLTLPSGARNALISFIAWKREVGERLSKRAPLFVSRQSGRLSRKQAHVIFKAVYEKVGLQGHVTTHSPRKSYAKTVYEKSNNDLLVTQRALRHTSVDMTLYYLETISDDVTHQL
jgi:integrase